MNAKSARKPRPIEVGRRERGTIAVESSFCLIVLLFFLLMSPAIWKMWIKENIARHDAERETFELTSSFIDLNEYTQLGEQVINGELDDLIFGTDPEAADIPDLSPEPPDDLDGYKDFPNKVVIGTQRTDVYYSSGWSMFRGKIEIKRNAYTIRPTWTWHGYPFVHTQDIQEPQAIEDWYKEAYEATLDDSTVDALVLETDPL